MNIFSFYNYKYFLNDLISKGEFKRPGIKRALASFAGCHSSYVSQVLNGEAHFSHEQILKIANFIGLTNDEKDYLILLLDYAKASTADLQSYYLAKIKRFADEKMTLKTKLDEEVEVDEVFQREYFSNKYFVLIHMMMTLPVSLDARGIATSLGVPISLVHECVSLLQKYGLVKKVAGKFIVTEKKMHLHRDSEFLSTYHKNLRLLVLDRIDRKSSTDYFYSSVISLSEVDLLKIKNVLLDTTKEIKDVVKGSAEECVVLFNWDLSVV